MRISIISSKKEVNNGNFNSKNPINKNEFREEIESKLIITKEFHPNEPRNSPKNSLSRLSQIMDFNVIII